MKSLKRRIYIAASTLEHDRIIPEVVHRQSKIGILIVNLYQGNALFYIVDLDIGIETPEVQRISQGVDPDGSVVLAAVDHTGRFHFVLVVIAVYFQLADS